MQPSRRVKIRPDPSLRGLIGLYEQNYQRMRQLLPEFPLPFNSAESHSQSDRRLHLSIRERTPYTTILHMTYLFDQGGVVTPDPDMDIRMFHDAGVAEVLACDMHPRILNFGDFDFDNCSALEARWQRNLFLNKWLDYLLAHGHGFVLAHRPRLRNSA